MGCSDPAAASMGLEVGSGSRSDPDAGRRQVTHHVTPTLEDAQRWGFLGPGPVGDHITHAWPLLARLPRSGLIADLGSGGGVLALILAVASPGTVWVLVESQRRRAAFLRTAIDGLGITSRVSIAEQRAEEAGRGALRATAAAVTARSFAPPAVTAECAAPLLRPGGSVWVAEPPSGAGSRWPEEGLGQLGLVQHATLDGWTELRQERECPERYPRRVGVPAKRPLF